MLTTTAFWYLLLTLTHFWQETWEFLKEKKSAYIQIGFREKFRVYKLMKFSKTTLFSKKSNEEKAESLKRLFGTIGIWKSYGEVDLNFFENLFALQVRVIIIFYFFLLTQIQKFGNSDIICLEIVSLQQGMLHVWSTTNGSIFLFEF